MGKRLGLANARTLTELRERASALFREQAAILVLVNHVGRLSAKVIESMVKEIDAISKHKELRALIYRLEITVSQLRKEYGVRITRSEILELMEWIHQGISPPQSCYLPAGTMAKDIAMYERLGLPPHALISVDPLCLNRDYPGGFEIRLLDASLFEDMCALFNECHACYRTLDRAEPVGWLPRKLRAKKHAALMRATTSAAFYFVEAYINCLATDHIHEHKNNLSERDLTLMTEWDASRQRRRFVSTREKLLHYPRIITRASSPPLDENNCSELKYFVTSAKEFRDALVHASASIDPIEEYPKKEFLIGMLSQEDVVKIVDTAVVLIQKVETVIRGQPPKWLHPRTGEGVFPDQVFE